MVINKTFIKYHFVNGIILEQPTIVLLAVYFIPYLINLFVAISCNILWTNQFIYMHIIGDMMIKLHNDQSELCRSKAIYKSLKYKNDACI